MMLGRGQDQLSLTASWGYSIAAIRRNQCSSDAIDKMKEQNFPFLDVEIGQEGHHHFIASEQVNITNLRDAKL